MSRFHSSSPFYRSAICNTALMVRSDKKAAFWALGSNLNSNQIIYLFLTGSKNWMKKMKWIVQKPHANALNRIFKPWKLEWDNGRYTTSHINLKSKVRQILFKHARWSIKSTQSKRTMFFCRCKAKYEVCKHVCVCVSVVLEPKSHSKYYFAFVCEKKNKEKTMMKQITQNIFCKPIANYMHHSNVYE